MVMVIITVIIKTIIIIIIIVVVIMKWVCNKGNESVDNYPVLSFFNGPAAFCDSNTSPFILVLGFISNPLQIVLHRKIHEFYNRWFCIFATQRYTATIHVNLDIAHFKARKKIDLGLAKNTKCLVNVDAFIGKTIGSDIGLDWIFIDSWAGENFWDQPIPDQTMEHLKPKIPNIKDFIIAINKTARLQDICKYLSSGSKILSAHVWPPVYQD